uniref:hypothetical protein n=1 Tax=Faecalibacillus intestinalis TaxID=1982626 RepID=UPI002FDB8DBF
IIKIKLFASYPLYSEINVKKMNFLDKLLRVYKSLIYPLYSEINVKKMNFLDKLLRVYKSLI